MVSSGISIEYNNPNREPFVHISASLLFFNSILRSSSSIFVSLS